MADLVTEHGLDLFALHALQKTGADRDQGLVLVGTGGERVRLGRIEDADFGHADAGLAGLDLHGLEQPRLHRVARLVDDAHAHHAFGAPLGHQQRDDRAAETEHRGEHQQTVGAAALRGDVLVEAEQPHGDRQHEHHGEVGDEEQQDAFHGC